MEKGGGSGPEWKSMRIRGDRSDEISVRKPVDIGIIQFERWNALKKEATKLHGMHLTHESFAKLLLDCWEKEAT